MAVQNLQQLGWIRPGAVIVAIFGLIGWPLSIFVALDAGLLLGVGVLISGSLLLFIAAVAWILSPGADQLEPKQ